MRKKVKTLVFITAAGFFFHPLRAQQNVPVASSFGNDIKKVMADYSSHFSHLTGNIIIENPQSADYQCNCQIAGAEESTITVYNSKNKKVVSWQAVMLTTDGFAAAKKKFNSLFGQLNNLTVSTGGTKNFRLKGVYKPPVEEKKFTSVLFSFDPADESVRNLRTELSLEFYAPMEWKVKVLVYDRDRKDNEKGKTAED